MQYLVLPKLGKFDVSFKAGGSKTYTNYDDVREDFLSGVIHPSDLKPALATAVNEMLEPVRQHFNTDPVAKDLLEKMEKYMAERAAKAKAAQKQKGKKAGGGKAGKGDKGGKVAGAAAAGPPPIFDVSDPAVISMLDIRVGSIRNPRVHPSADKLYVEDIDIAEDKPRQICSGLVPYIPVQGMSGLCCVVSNLKSRKMQGVDSNGMVLAAQSADGTAVELLRTSSHLTRAKEAVGCIIFMLP